MELPFLYYLKNTVVLAAMLCLQLCSWSKYSHIPEMEFILLMETHNFYFFFFFPHAFVLIAFKRFVWGDYSKIFFFSLEEWKVSRWLQPGKKARTTKNCLLCLNERKNNLSGKCRKLCFMASWNWNGVPLMESQFRKKKNPVFLSLD